MGDEAATLRGNSSLLKQKGVSAALHLEGVYKPKTEDRRPKTEDRRPKTQKPKTENRRPKTTKQRPSLKRFIWHENIDFNGVFVL